jgi:DNA repair protein RecN (Recombination protein N)
MLQSIHIQNYALIESLDIDFHSGFSVITGETGAGKSIILGAIGLLVGQRADIKAIKTGANKCIVEARFQIENYELEHFFEEHDLEYEGGECILRRELYASGKSRAFINDSPASLVQMKEVGEKLIDVHSQHQNLLLNHEDFQLSVLDILAHDENELQAYKYLYSEYKKVSHELKDILEQAEKNRQDEDYIRYQVQQLEEANLQSGEQEALEQESETLSHAEEIKSNLYRADGLLESGETTLISGTKECMQTLQSISKVYTPAQEWIERLNSCYIELKELGHEIANASEEVEFNPSRLEYVNERLNLIYTLQQKHRVSSGEELLEIAEEYQSKLEAITSYDSRIEELTKQKEILYNKVLKQAEVLTAMRAQAGKEIEEQMQAYLIPLGMPNVRFAVELAPRKEPDAKGMDGVNFLFSANKNGTLQQVASIASGGEIARVMLSLKAMIAGAVKLPTIIFDEIDTGVSGSIAEKMALIMQEMGQANRQVISITHLPQIAAKGSTHYKVYKEDTEVGTNSHIRQLNEEERIHEIANMLSGATLTEAALNNAKALLNNEALL